jgi:hypothetical protein
VKAAFEPATYASYTFSFNHYFLSAQYIFATSCGVFIFQYSKSLWKLFFTPKARILLGVRNALRPSLGGFGSSCGRFWEEACPSGKVLWASQLLKSVS